MLPTKQLQSLGQSLWLDNIARDLLSSGTRYIDELSVTGLTSNPTIFDHAIRNSAAYDEPIREGLRPGKTGEDLFFDLGTRGHQKREAAGIFLDYSKNRATDETIKLLLNLAVAEVWRRGSVIASWLLDLTATARADDPALSKFSARVSDSGEGGWTIAAAIDEAVPVPVLSAALYERFSSRGEADHQDKLLSAMRFQFGGHVEESAGEQAA